MCSKYRSHFGQFGTNDAFRLSVSLCPISSRMCFHPLMFMLKSNNYQQIKSAETNDQALKECYFFKRNGIKMFASGNHGPNLNDCNIVIVDHCKKTTKFSGESIGNGSNTNNYSIGGTGACTRLGCLPFWKVAVKPCFSTELSETNLTYIILFVDLIGVGSCEPHNFFNSVADSVRPSRISR